jgi:hypothetical protein
MQLVLAAGQESPWYNWQRQKNGPLDAVQRDRMLITYTEHDTTVEAAKHGRIHGRAASVLLTVKLRSVNRRAT